MSPVDIKAETPSERAVRCAAGWGHANLALARVRAAAEAESAEVKQRLLAALDGPVTE